MRTNSSRSPVASRSSSLVALLSVTVTGAWVCAGAASAACVILALPDGPALARFLLDDHDPVFRVTYVHSVTQTPVDEVYRVERHRIIETEIRFVEHGPGLPTAADAGGAFERRDGAFVVRGRRSFDAIVMRVHGDQQPRLSTNAQFVDLAQWGDRALAMTAHAGGCAAP